MLIMIETGEITRPISVNMTIQQKEQIKHLIAPIVEKDSKYIIDNLYFYDKTMDTINYEYISLEKNRFNSNTYFFDCKEDKNKLGEIITGKLLCFGYIFKRNSLTKIKGWYIYENYWIEKSKILQHFNKQIGIKKVKIHKQQKI